ncbi:MAG: ATPase, T2SS/T4P/T4SS family [Patescibacteria group bacterium]|nr:ATPase, T2SS/T4P/T4SS family [Patescibacteria group bacterium]
MLSLKQNLKEQLAIDLDIKVLRVIDKIFNFAIGCEADEIYFEPTTKNLAINFRAGGELKKTLLLSKKIEPAVIVGVKEMAGLNYPTDNSPTSGRFKKDYLGYKIIFSLGVHQTVAGEKIVVNLFKEKFELLSLGRLGLNEPALEKVKKNLAAKKGLVAVIGDYNSGRTATLYSFINFLKNRELNIATVEQDVAADLPEINQSRLNPSVGFGSRVAINAIRRQDADVVMIGEVNDLDTVAAAFHLASAGHFVLAGFYSRDLLGTLEFLLDLGLPLSLFSANTGLAITQRLVDKNCPHCLTRQKAGQEHWRRLQKKISLAKLLPRLKRDKIVSEKIFRPEELIFYKSRGCPRCQNSGKAGKVGIFEVLEITPAVKNLIKTGHFSAIRQELTKQDGYSLAEDALIKSLSGLISIEEVLRVIN